METNISKSAYILVYDKIKKSKLRFKFDKHNINEFDKIISVVKNKEYTFEDNVLEIDFYNINPYIPEEYRKIISDDNISMVLENQLFSGSFTSFFHEILS